MKDLCVRAHWLSWDYDYDSTWWLVGKWVVLVVIGRWVFHMHVFVYDNYSHKKCSAKEQLGWKNITLGSQLYSLAEGIYFTKASWNHLVIWLTPWPFAPFLCCSKRSICQIRNGFIEPTWKTVRHSPLIQWLLRCLHSYVERVRLSVPCSF